MELFGLLGKLDIESASTVTFDLSESRCYLYIAKILSYFLGKVKSVRVSIIASLSKNDN